MQVDSILKSVRVFTNLCTREDLINDWVIEQQENPIGDFYEIVDRLSESLKISNSDLVWEEMNKDLIMFVEELNSRQK